MSTPNTSTILVHSDAAFRAAVTAELRKVAALYGAEAPAVDTPACPECGRARCFCAENERENAREYTGAERAQRRAGWGLR